MASVSKRRGSMGIPPNLEDGRNKLLTEADLFIQQFEDSEWRLRDIDGEMKTVSELVQRTQSTVPILRMGGVVTGGVRVAIGVGLGLFICAAPLIGGLGLAAVAAVLSGATVAAVNISRIIRVSRGAEKVEQLGIKFTEIVEPMRAQLEEIKRLCEHLDENTAAVQAENTLADMDELQKVLQQTSALRKRSRGVLGVGVAVWDEVRELLTLISSVLRVTSTHQQEKSLRESIISSVDQSGRVIIDFHMMKEELQHLRGEFKNSGNKQS